MAEEREVRSRASVASSVLGQLLPSDGIAAVTFRFFRELPDLEHLECSHQPHSSHLQVREGGDLNRLWRTSRQTTQGRRR